MRSLIRLGLSVGFGLTLALLWVWLLGQPPMAAQAAPLGADIVVTTTIQAAIDAAQPGDRIIIPTGVFTENLVVTKLLTFLGAGVGSTIIDGNNAGRVMTTSSGISIAGLTIRSGNAGSGAGGGIFASDGLTLTNVAILSNTSVANGGGAYVGGAAVVSGGLFQNNHSTGSNYWGGGLYVQGSLALTGTQFISNTVDGRGGGALAYGPATVWGGKFQNNHSGENGGGLFANDTLMLSGTQFLSNTADGSGGGGCVYDAATISSGLFQNNQSNAGGGLWGLGVTLTSTQFLSNTSVGSGGGANVSGAVLSGGLFQSNRCTGSTCSGGGLLAGGSLMLTGTKFNGNASGGFGGGLRHGSGDARLVNALFARNSATANGAAAALESAGTVVILHATVASPTVGSGAAIYVTAGTVGITDTIVASYTSGIERVGGVVYQDYNLLFNAPVSGTVGGGSHNPGGSPAFSSPASDDYHLTAGSAAINRGVRAGVWTDIDGDARPDCASVDIGADEFLGLPCWRYILVLIFRR